MLMCSTRESRFAAAIGAAALMTGLSAPNALAGTTDLPDIGLGWVEVGDPGNAPMERFERDPVSGEITGFYSNFGRGTVDYSYRMTRSEIGAGDFLPFLQRFTTQSDALGNFLRVGGTRGFRRDPFYFGPGRRYIVSDLFPEGVRERAQIAVSWHQAAAYVNWLHNGQTSNPEDLFQGAYDLGTINDDGSITVSFDAVRQPGARFALPTLDEHLKAAHYDPTRDEPDGSQYWLYPHQSEEPPVWGLPGEGETLYRIEDPELEQLIEDTYYGAGYREIPIGEFPETSSYYGLIDVLSGKGEYFETDEGFCLGCKLSLLAGSNVEDTDLFQLGEAGLVPQNTPVMSFRVVQIPAPSTSLIFWVVSGVGLARRQRCNQEQIIFQRC